MFASKTAQGFYDASIHSSMPEDAVEISAERHAELLSGQSAGKVIDFSADNGPVLIDPPPPCAELLADTARQWRDGAIESVRWLRERHRDEVDSERSTTLTAAQSGELLDYVQALRDWPKDSGFPAIESRPIRPAWIADQIK